MTTTILTLGGGGFSMSPDGSSAIDDFLLGLTGTARPRVCFVPTASGDDDGYSRRFEEAFEGRATTSVLSLFGHEPWGYTDPAALLDQDVVYVGGGSTANLLAVWRVHGLPDLLARAAAGGTVLAGISAGMNCWYQASSTDSFGPLAALDDGLGLLPGSACPHYLGESERRGRYQEFVATGALPDGHAADDGVALLWRDGVLVDVVSERADGQAFTVTRVGDRGVETPLAVRRLT